MKEKTELRRRLALHLMLAGVSVPAAILIAFKLQQIKREIEWAVRVDFGVDRILRSHRPDFILMSLGAVLVLAGLVSFVRVFVLCRRLNRLQGDPLADAARERAVRSEAERAVASPQDGRDRYLRQLEEHLKNGIIDRAEYRLLKERYRRR